MARLYIAEKPSLAKDVMAVFDGRPSRNGAAYKVGDDFFVPLKGHILAQAMPDFYLPDDVPLNRNGNKIWHASDLPVIPSTWVLQPQEQHAPILDAIRQLLTNVDEVVHLSDPDAEGQLLADVVLEYLGNTLPVKRLLANNNNPNEIHKALANLRDNDEPEFRAWCRWALARSRYDWLFGLNFTRAATCRAQSLGFDALLSVGSVQTPVLQIVFERDDKIERFTATSYFLLSAQLQHAKGAFTAKWRAAHDQPGLDEDGRLVDPDVAAALAQSLTNAPASVSAFERKPARDLAPLPLSMNELTVEACRRFGCTAAEVLEATQELYDRYKLTTYPRTENRYLAEAQHGEVPDVLAALAANRADLAPLVDRADPTLRSRAFDDKKMEGKGARMMPIDFAMLAQQCAPTVHPTTLQAIVKTESGFNPYAIGVVGGRLARQPRSRDEAVATARALEAAGWNYSMGLAQVNCANLRIYGLTSETVFDPCANLRAGGAILADCYTRTTAGGRVPQDAVRAALSCYYSGNFTRGFKRDFGGTSYVQRVATNATSVGASATVVPPIAVVPDGAAPASRGAARPARLRRADDSSTTGADRGRETDQHPAWDALGDF